MAGRGKFTRKIAAPEQSWRLKCNSICVSSRRTFFFIFVFIFRYIFRLPTCCDVATTQQTRRTVRVPRDTDAHSSLNYRISIISYFETAPEIRIPVRLVALLTPRDVRHLTWVYIWKYARFSAATHVTVHVHGVVWHTQVRVNPVPSWNALTPSLDRYYSIL